MINLATSIRLPTRSLLVVFSFMVVINYFWFAFDEVLAFFTRCRGLFLTYGCFFIVHTLLFFKATREDTKNVGTGLEDGSAN